MPEEYLGVGYTVDAEGNPFHGRHQYRIKFAAERLPPLEPSGRLRHNTADPLCLCHDPLKPYKDQFADAERLERDADAGLLSMSNTPPWADKEANLATRCRIPLWLDLPYLSTRERFVAANGPRRGRASSLSHQGHLILGQSIGARHNITMLGVIMKYHSRLKKFLAAFASRCLILSSFPQTLPRCRGLKRRQPGTQFGSIRRSIAKTRGGLSSKL